jgi:hypothetical protein
LTVTLAAAAPASNAASGLAVVMGVKFEVESRRDGAQAGEIGGHTLRMGQTHGVGQAQPPDGAARHGAHKIVEKTGIGPRIILRADGDKSEARGGLDGQTAQLAQHPGAVLAPDAKVQVRDGKGKVHAEHVAGGRGREIVRVGPAPREHPPGADGADDGTQVGDGFGSGDRDAGLQLGHAGLYQCAGDGQLVGARENHSGGLFAVAQGGVDQVRTKHGRKGRVG